MRRLALFAFLLLLAAACTPPPAVDATVIDDLTVGIRATCVAMAIEVPGERILADQAGLLAIQSPPERVRAIRSGELSANDLQKQGGDALALLERDRPGLQPPVLLAWLVDHGQGLEVPQLLLLDALTIQALREAHLDDRKR